MTTHKRDPALVVCTASAGLISAFIAMCLRFSFGHYAVALHNRLLDLSQNCFPGAVFGAIISCCFAWRGYLRSARRFVAITVASAVAYFAAFWVAVGVELYSPFLAPAKRGDVSGQALFFGGLAGAFCVTCAVSLLLNSERPWHRRMDKAVCWSPAGAVLGVLGWALGPSLGMLLWQIIHAMNLTGPSETFQNAQGYASHNLSLWAVWQTGMGFVLGLVVNGMRSADGKSPQTESAKLITSGKDLSIRDACK